MSRYLLADVGAGTMDVLYVDDESDLHYKAVVKSPVRQLAELADGLPGSLLVTGGEMGGGPVSEVLKRRAGQAEVVMTVSSAATLHHDMDRVRSWGIRVIGESEVAPFLRDRRFSRLHLSDVSAERLEKIVNGFGVPFSFDVFGFCAQDHGVAPRGVSHLDFRHRLFKEKLDKTPRPEALLYAGEEVPAHFNRLRTAAMDARRLPAKEIYVMDSGMAAILGAAMDHRARSKERILLLDVATSHTVGAGMENDELSGFFEYHTRDISREKIERLLRDLADGKLVHEQILKEGGHGVYQRRAFGFAAAELILATGPRRGLVHPSSLPVEWGAPFGDNMMTGTAGLLEAIFRKKGYPPMVYL